MTIGSDYNITALSGAGMIVQYSVDKETWHTALDENKDKWMRFKYGSDSDWSVFKIGGKDGRGIVSQQTFYLATSSGSVPSVLVYADEDKRYYTDENGDYYLSGNWTDVTQLATEEKPYLWTFTVTFYDDGTIYTTEPALAATWVKGDIGDQGEPGVPFVARQNYSAFSSYARGSVYVHGYFLQDKQWIQADVPGYFTMDSKTYWIWGAAAPLSSVDGYLCVRDSSTSKPAQRISACKPVICFNTVSDKSKWKTLSAGTGKAADMDNPENLIAFARIKTSSVSGSVYVDTIEPARLSDISASDEGAFSLSYEGIAAEYGTVSSFKDYETAEITPYEVLPVSASKNTYTLSPKEKKYAQRGSVMFKIISTVKESPSISDSGDSVYPVVPAASQSDTQIWAFNGTFWEYVDTAKWCYSECSLLMGHDLPGIAGLYAGEGLGTPSVCGTYIKTLTANRAFINELVANEAFIRKLGTNELHIDTEGENTGKIYGGVYKADGTVDSSKTGGGFYLGADGSVKIKGELVIGGTDQSVSDAISDATSASEFTYTRLYYYSSKSETPSAPAGFKTVSALNTWTSSATAPSGTARTYYSYCYRTGSGTYTYGEVSQNAAEIDSAIATAESNANAYTKAQIDEVSKNLSENYSTKEDTIKSYVPCYYQTNDGSQEIPSAPTSSTTIYGDTAGNHWSSKSGPGFTYTYVSYKYTKGDGTAAYTDPSADPNTIIKDGKIATDLIDVQTLLAKDITLKKEGYIQSDSYDEKKQGFKLDAESGTITAVNGNFNGGNFNSITVSGQSTFQGLMKQGLQSYKGVFLSFIYYNNEVKVINTGLKGLKIERIATGKYLCTINKKDMSSSNTGECLDDIIKSSDTCFVGVETILASDYLFTKQFTHKEEAGGTRIVVTCAGIEEIPITETTTVTDAVYYGATPYARVNCQAVAPTDGFFSDQKVLYKYGADMSVSRTSEEYLMTPLLVQRSGSEEIKTIKKGKLDNFPDKRGYSNMYVADNEIQFCLVFTDFNSDKYRDVTGGCSLVLNFYGLNTDNKKNSQEETD